MPLSESELEDLCGWIAIRCLRGQDVVRKYVEDEWDGECQRKKYQTLSPRYVLANALSGVARATIVVHDPDDLWKLMETSFTRRLPSLKYNWDNGRVINGLQLVVVPPSHKSVSYHISTPLDGYKLPYVHLYIVKCDSLENYKAAIRARLRAWVDDLQSQSNGLDKIEWIIVYVPIIFQGKTGSGPDNKQSVLSKKIFEKIRTDFNDMKKQTCCKISLVRGTAGQPSQGFAGDGEWGELLRRICKFTVSSFHARKSMYESQLAKLEEQKDVPGWNYCTYLVVKENLAFSWLQLGQFYDALRLFDSLSMQFDSITDVDWETKRTTSKLYLDLYRAQVLRLRLSSKTIQETDSNKRNEEETVEQASATEGGDGSSSSILHDQKITGSLSRRLSHSLSFGPKGNVSAGGPNRIRADSLIHRLSIDDGDDGDLKHQDSAATLSVMVSGDTPQPPDDPRPPEPPSPTSGSLVSEVPSVFLNVKRKPYREQIYKSSLSILEIRLYLFVRSTLLLFTIGRTDEALRRGIHFIASFSKDMVRASEQSKASEEGHNLDEVETKVIALSWAFCSSIELVSASHTAIASTEESDKDISPDTVLYQSELFAFATVCFQEIVGLIYPDEPPLSPSGEPNPSSCAQSWFSKLPSFIIGAGRGKCELQGRDLQSWIPVGVYEALLDEQVCRKLVSGLIKCRGEYLEAAGRRRNAVRLAQRRAQLHAAHGQWSHTLRVLHNEVLTTEHYGLIKTWPTLDADVKMISARSHQQTGNLVAVVLSCLESLCLDHTQHRQRLDALGLLEQTIRGLNLSPSSRSESSLREMKCPGTRFKLFQATVLESSSASFPPKAAAVEEREEALVGTSPAQRKRHTHIHRTGEVISLKVHVSSWFPEDVVVDRVYVRLCNVSSSPVSPIKRKDKSMVTGGFSSSASSSKLHSLVSYNSTDKFDISKYETEEEDEECQSREGVSSPSGAVKQDELLEEEKMLDDDNETLLEDGTTPPVSKFVYFESLNMRLKKGEETVYLLGKPKNKWGCFHAAGVYKVDRIGVTIGKLSLITPVSSDVDGDRGNVDFRLRIFPMPPLFRVQVISPLSSFIPLDERKDKTIPVELSVKSNTINDYPEVSKVEVYIDFDEGEEVSMNNFELIGDVNDPVGVCEAADLAKPEEVSKTLTVKLRDIHSRISGVDQITLPHRARIRILQKKSLGSSEVASIEANGNMGGTIPSAKCKLKVELHLTLSQCYHSLRNDKQERMETSLVQVEHVSLAYSQPFVLSQCSKFYEGQIWHLLQFQSRLPYQVTMSNVNLADSSVPVASLANSSYRIAQGQDLRISFTSNLVKDSEQVNMKLTAEYSSQDENAMKGYIEKTISFKQKEVDRYIEIDSSCANKEPVRVGSTATFVYRLALVDCKRDESKTATTIVKAMFAGPEAPLMDVSSSPFLKRCFSSSTADAVSKKKNEDIDDELDSLPGTDDTDEPVRYIVLFDPSQWMVVGSERGHINLETDSNKVECECIPLTSGRLPFPVIEIATMYGVHTMSKRYLKVYD